MGGRYWRVFPFYEIFLFFSHLSSMASSGIRLRRRHENCCLHFFFFFLFRERFSLTINYSLILKTLSGHVSHFIITIFFFNFFLLGKLFFFIYALACLIMSDFIFLMFYDKFSCNKFMLLNCKSCKMHVTSDLDIQTWMSFIKLFISYSITTN